MDVRGRTVATLVDGVLPAGRNTVSWRGEGGRGTSLASGIYCCRLDAGGRREVRKVVIRR